jgi:hypothetical protein
MSVAAMLIALKTMFDPATDARVSYALEVAGEHFEVAIADHTVRITRGRAADPVATITTDVTTLRMIVFLGTGVRAAEDAGALTISGDRRAAARFPTYFRRPGAATR